MESITSYQIQSNLEKTVHSTYCVNYRVYMHNNLRMHHDRPSNSAAIYLIIMHCYLIEDLYIILRNTYVIGWQLRSQEGGGA